MSEDLYRTLQDAARALTAAADQLTRLAPDAPPEQATAALQTAMVRLESLNMQLRVVWALDQPRQLPVAERPAVAAGPGVVRPLWPGGV